MRYTDDHLLFGLLTAAVLIGALHTADAGESEAQNQTVSEGEESQKTAEADQSDYANKSTDEESDSKEGSGATKSKDKSTKATESKPAPSGKPAEVPTNQEAVARQWESCRWVRMEKDRHADGTIERVDTRRFDEAGHLVRRSRGPIVFEYRRDAQGRWTRKVQYGEEVLLHTYRGLDSDPNRIFTREFDDEGRLVEEKRDLDADGRPDYVVEHRYESREGRRVEIETTDVEADGQIDRTVRTFRNADGQKVREERERRGLPEPHVLITWTYDIDGNLVRRQRYEGEFGWNHQGDRVREKLVLTSIITKTWDDEGRLV